MRVIRRTGGERGGKGKKFGRERENQKTCAEGTKKGVQETKNGQADPFVKTETLEREKKQKENREMLSDFTTRKNPMQKQEPLMAGNGTHNPPGKNSPKGRKRKRDGGDSKAQQGQKKK